MGDGRTLVDKQRLHRTSSASGQVLRRAFRTAQDLTPNPLGSSEPEGPSTHVGRVGKAKHAVATCEPLSSQLGRTSESRAACGSLPSATASASRTRSPRTTPLSAAEHGLVQILTR